MPLFFFQRYIIGKKGETRRRLEADTKTSISIPKQGVEGQIGETFCVYHRFKLNHILVL